MTHLTIHKTFLLALSLMVVAPALCMDQDDLPIVQVVQEQPNLPKSSIKFLI